MTQPKRFAVKYFAQGDITFDLAALIPVFQRWIQEHTVEGLLIDIADYKHVYQGPGILLIGHEADYSFDLRGGRPGLLYTRKRDIQDSLVDNLTLAFRLAKSACEQLEAEPALIGLRFAYDEAEILFLDRLATPNTPQVFEQLRSDLQQVASALYQTESVNVSTVEPDARLPLTVRIAALQESGAW